MIGDLTLTVTYEDGSEQQVRSDQRDAVRWERDERIPAGRAIEEMPNAFFWTIAYYASQRAGLVERTVKRDAWEAGVKRVQIDAQDDDADPGNPVAQDEMPSSSRSGQGRASGKSASTGRRATSRR